MLDPKNASLVGAVNVVGGDKLNKALHDLAAVAKTKEPDLAKAIKLNADKAAGVRFHVISVPIPADADNHDKWVQLLGETADLALGVANGALYVAAGRDALATLKKTVEKSAADGPKAVLPGSFSVALAAVAKCGRDVARPGPAHGDHAFHAALASAGRGPSDRRKHHDPPRHPGAGGT